MSLNKETIIGGWLKTVRLLDKIFLYSLIIIVPLMIYPISINNTIIDIRKIREISFYSLAVIISSFLQNNKWLRYFIIWCVFNWWLNFFTPPQAYIGLTNIFSALILYIGIKYLLEKKILTINVLLKIISSTVIFQFGWMLMQLFIKKDPIFYGYKISYLPLVSWSGNPTFLATFIACNSFLLLHYFRIKKIPLLFFIVLTSLLILKSFTAIMCFLSAGLFYLWCKDYNKRKTFFIVLLIILIGISFAFFIKSPNLDRLHIWKRLITDSIKLRPFVGRGINFFEHLLIIDKTNTPWQEAHNDYLQIFLELGLIGFILFSGFIIDRFLFFFKQIRDNKQIAIASCLTAYLIAGISLFPMRFAQLSFYAIVLWSCLEYSYNEIKIL